LLDTATVPDWGSVVQQMAQQFTSIMTTILTTINNTVIDIARLAYVSILLVGLLLYFSHAERRLGKDLIRGGIILAILSEFVFPQLNRL
jgi:anti-anti-sigma regulatory factor